MLGVLSLPVPSPVPFSRMAFLAAGLVVEAHRQVDARLEGLDAHGAHVEGTGIGGAACQGSVEGGFGSGDVVGNLRIGFAHGGAVDGFKRFDGFVLHQRQAQVVGTGRIGVGEEVHQVVVGQRLHGVALCHVEVHLGLVGGGEVQRLVGQYLLRPGNGAGAAVDDLEAVLPDVGRLAGGFIDNPVALGVEVSGRGAAVTYAGAEVAVGHGVVAQESVAAQGVVGAVHAVLHVLHRLVFAARGYLLVVLGLKVASGQSQGQRREQE